MATFEVKIDQSDLDEVARMMRGIKDGYPTVVSGAINTTLKGVKTDTKTEIRDDVTVKARAIAKTIKIVRANKHRVSGALRSKGIFLPLTEYKHSQTKKGVTVQISKGGKKTLWPSAFISIMKKEGQRGSGHKGVFQREKPPYRTHRSNKLPWKRFQKKDIKNKKYRLKIHQQFGPRVPGIMGKDEIINPILKKAGDRIHKELDRRMDFELNKYK